MTKEKANSKKVISEVDNIELEKEAFIEMLKQEQSDDVKKLEAERDEYKNKYLYALADLDNTKKHFSSERARLIDTAVSNTVNKIFTVIDDFERAIESAKKSDDVESLKNGYSVLYDKFISILKDIGVEKIDTENADFNTDYHDAVTVVPGDESKKNKVIDCLRDGYTYNGKVIRHAKVAVGG